MTTYSNRSNAIRAARRVLASLGIADAMSGVHFRLQAVGDEYAWHQIDVDTGHVATGELVDNGAVTADEAEALTALSHTAEVVVEQAVGLEVAPLAPEPRQVRRDRLVAEAHKRHAESKAAPKVRPAPKPKGADKRAQLMAQAMKPEGITEQQLKDITGWNNFGGFYNAAKNAGIKLTRTKVDGHNVWHGSRQA